MEADQSEEWELESVAASGKLGPPSSSNPREFKRLLEAMHDGIAIVHEGGVVFENEALESVIGLSPGKIPPRRTSHLFRLLMGQIDPDWKAPLKVALLSVARGRQPATECEVRLLHPGRPKFVHFFFDAIYFAGRAALMVTAREVSEYREIKELLNRSERMAAIGTLAAGVAHEINNPLSYVTTNITYAIERIRYLDQLLSGHLMQVDSPATLRPLLTPLLHALKEAHDGTNRVATIVRDLRVLSRESDDQQTAVDLARTLDAAIHMAEQTYRYRARFVRDYGKVGSVWGTETRLVQVFLNLVVNAAQAFAEDDPTRNEVVIRVELEGKHTAVEVTDNGPGIAPADHEKIFAPFFTTKPVGEGTGLGLSICHSILDAAGGSISVQSELGCGATFRVCLRPCDMEAPPSKPRRTSLRPAGRARVLIVDDEMLLLRSLARLLQEHHDVSTATNGRDGLAKLQQDGPFDLILCDLMMPDMNGMDLFDETRRLLPDAAERFVFLTGGAVSERARSFLASVPNPKLEKPIEPHLLRNIVATFLRGPD